MYRRSLSRQTRLPRSEREKPRAPRQPRVTARQAAENEAEQPAPSFLEQNAEELRLQQEALAPIKRKGSSNKAGSQYSYHTMIVAEISPGVYGV